MADVIRRVVRARLGSVDEVDDLVQETLARLLGGARRLDDGALGPYAIVTARNLVASHWRRTTRVGATSTGCSIPRSRRAPDETRRRGRGGRRPSGPRWTACRTAEREVLVGPRGRRPGRRPIAGRRRGIDGGRGRRPAQSLPGEAACRVPRSSWPASRRRHAAARSLLSLSAGDRRRQAELDVGYHLLDCDFCAGAQRVRCSTAAPKDADDEVRVPVRVDADVVTARQQGRELAIARPASRRRRRRSIATAISEIARNIVRFARAGRDRDGDRAGRRDASGVTIVARDAGPGIADIEQALEVGYTTYGGRGLGLPGSPSG